MRSGHRLGGLSGVFGTAASSLLLATALPTGGRAVTIDFESVPTSGCGDVQGVQLTTQGFGFLAAGDGAALFTCDSTDPNYAGNGTIWLSAALEASGGAGLNTAPILVWEAQGLPFSLLAFDASELAAAALLPGDGVRVQSFDASDHLLAEATFAFDGQIDGPGGAGDFETFALPAGFQNVASVIFQALDYDGLFARFSIDNLVVVPVPEPGSAALLLLGLAGLGLAAGRVRPRRARPRRREARKG
jgi:hypothetical protein